MEPVLLVVGYPGHNQIYDPGEEISLRGSFLCYNLLVPWAVIACVVFLAFKTLWADPASITVLVSIIHAGVARHNF
jgi:hypothetical protein